jgi:hypothetical protein
MWNSNSVISWLIVRSGLAADSIQPPAGGRAPGWDAGLVVARRREPPADPPARAISIDQPPSNRPSDLKHAGSSTGYEAAFGRALSGDSTARIADQTDPE